jgi:hypothetical protein
VHGLDVGRQIRAYVDTGRAYFISDTDHGYISPTTAK